MHICMDGCWQRTLILFLVFLALLMWFCFYVKNSNNNINNKTIEFDKWSDSTVNHTTLSFHKVSGNFITRWLLWDGSPCDGYVISAQRLSKWTVSILIMCHNNNSMQHQKEHHISINLPHPTHKTYIQTTQHKK